MNVSSKKVIIQTPAATGNTRAYAVALAKVINKYHPWLRIVPVEGLFGPQAVKTIMQPEYKKNTIIASSNSYWSIARSSTLTPYGTPYTHYAIAQQFSPVCGVVTLNPDIRCWGDLREKKITINMYIRGSIFEDLFSTLLKFYGIYDEVDKVYLNHIDGTCALLEGKVDVTHFGFTCGPPILLPVPEFTKMIEERSDDLYFIPYKREELAEIAKKAAWYVLPARIPAEEIRKKLSVTHQNADLLWLKIVHFWGCDKEMDADITYEIVRVMSEHLDEFASDLVPAKLLNQETLAECGVPRDFIHPGALRYYDEQRIKITEPQALGWDK